MFFHPAGKCLNDISVALAWPYLPVGRVGCYGYCKFPGARLLANYSIVLSVNDKNARVARSGHFSCAAAAHLDHQVVSFGH
jgi:hypothetical protein